MFSFKKSSYTNVCFYEMFLFYLADLCFDFLFAFFGFFISIFR